MPQQFPPGAGRPRHAVFLWALGAGLALAAPAAGQGGPGSFDIDEEAAERALERALVQTGSVLLPARAIEVTPFFSFSRSETERSGDSVVVDTDGDGVGDTIRGATVTASSNEFRGGVTVRAGLPWRGQVDLTVPVGYTEIEDEERVTGVSFSSASRDVTGLGDIRLGYSQTLRREGGGFPSILAGITWDTDTGEEEDGVALGSGFNEIGVSLTATQRQDPLVFSGRIGYERALEQGDDRPGDEISFAASGFLAVSPETSLQFGLSMTYSDDFEIDGDGVPGSDQLAASLDLGVATILRRNGLLNTNVSIGLTDDSPDFAVSVSLPLRFTF